MNVENRDGNTNVRFHQQETLERTFTHLENSDIHINRARMDGDAELVDTLYTEEIKTYINQYKKVMSGKQVLLCTLAFYKENDKAKAKNIYEIICLQSDKCLMQGEVQMSIACMQSMPICIPMLWKVSPKLNIY